MEGEAFSRRSAGALVWGDGDVEVEMVAGYEAEFCSEGCEWVFELDKHRLLGMVGREARRHLTEVHGCRPGKPAGRQSDECWGQSAEIARAVARMVSGREDRCGN